MRIIKILFFCFAIIFPNLSTANNDSNSEMHVAVITEVINADAYTYIRCKENGVENWLLLPQTVVKVGELIEYPDGPATYNHKSDTINKKFNKLYVVPGIRNISNQKSLRSAFESGQADVYKHEDENGTLVFTDNPSILPNINRDR